MEKLLYNLRWCAAGLIASGLLLAVPFLFGGDNDGPIHEIVVFVLLYLWPFATAIAAMRATGAVATTLRLLAEPVLIVGSVFAVVLMYVAALACHAQSRLLCELDRVGHSRWHRLFNVRRSVVT